MPRTAFPQEMVLSVPTRKLYDSVGEWRGLRKEAPEIWRALARDSSFRPRPEIETDPSVKQLISYTMLISDKRMFVMRRLRSQSEARLRGLFSIGVGGHMNPFPSVDWPGRRLVRDLKALVAANNAREVREEVSLAGEPPFSILGFLNDDMNPVGKVHLGVVSVVSLTAPIVAVRETGKMVGMWVDLSEMRMLGEFETWSSLVLESLT